MQLPVAHAICFIFVQLSNIQFVFIIRPFCPVTLSRFSARNILGAEAALHPVADFLSFLCIFSAALVGKTFLPIDFKLKPGFTRSADVLYVEVWPKFVATCTFNGVQKYII